MRNTTMSLAVSKFRSRALASLTLCMGALLLMNGVAIAAQCQSFIPDPTDFPVAIDSSGAAHIEITATDGTVSVFDPQFTRPIFFTNPLDIATLLFGQQATDIFTACDGQFPTIAGTATEQFGAFLVDIEFTATGGPLADASLMITLDGTNNQPVFDGNPCTASAPCSLDVIHFVNTFDYTIASGFYTASTITDRHSLWTDPSNGSSFVQDVLDSGDGSGTVGVLIQSIPEPATLALLGIGMAGIGFARRAQQK